MKEVIFRKIKEADTESVLELMKALAIHHNQLEYVKIDKATFIQNAFQPNPTMGVYVAEQAGELIGYVSYTINFSIWYGARYLNIDDVFVKATFRNRGIGEKLMHFIRQETQNSSINRIRWESEEDNDKAIKFYKRLGASFKVKGIFNWQI